MGGLWQSLIKSNWRQVKERIAVFQGKEKDPFDSYDWLHRLHEENRVKPYYFFLLAEKNGRYDKNILPQQKALQALIGDHMVRYPVGIHPSWRSGDEHGLYRWQAVFDHQSAVNGHGTHAQKLFGQPRK